jgi:hypothetical protein
MATLYGANVVTDGLVLSLDAANPKSYPGSGTTWYDLNKRYDATLSSATFNSAGAESSFRFSGSGGAVTSGTGRMVYGIILCTYTMVLILYYI